MTRPLSVDTVEKVFSSIALNGKTRTRFGGYIPANMIAYKEGVRCNEFMWRTMPTHKMLLFTKAATIKSGIYAVPGLIWRFGDTLRLYAYKQWKGDETLLFKAPFMNVSTVEVCLGSGKDIITDSGTFKNFITAIQLVEKAFWESKFDHIGTDDHQINGSFSAMYKNSQVLNKDKLKEFDHAYLVKYSKSLKTIIDENFSS